MGTRGPFPGCKNAAEARGWSFTAPPPIQCRGQEWVGAIPLLPSPCASMACSGTALLRCMKVPSCAHTSIDKDQALCYSIKSDVILPHEIRARDFHNTYQTEENLRAQGSIFCVPRMFHNKINYDPSERSVYSCLKNELHCAPANNTQLLENDIVHFTDLNACF
jgi:hypothetical protein